MSKVLEIAISQIGIAENPPNSNKVKYNDWVYSKPTSGSSYPNRELWKDVVGFEGLYMISSKGRVICVGSDKSKIATISKNGDLILKQQDNRGYRKVLLTNGNRRITFSAHRLVAIAFIPNPENKPQVNHINGNKSDNSIENLEWSTSSENINHAFNTLNKVSCWTGRKGVLSHCSKKVTCVTTGEVFDSIKEAANKYGIDASNITNAIKGKVKRAAKKEWRLYVN